MKRHSGCSQCSRQVRGFTLLEVLMAMTILAIAGITVLRTSSESLDNSQYLKNKTMARWVADNELVDLYLKDQWPSQTWKKETRELADQTWHVRYRSVRTADENFRAIQVEVRLDRDEKKAALASLQTYTVKRS
ncbi:type II secretion system minor pseudopilin GspI [Endozoicomonas sp. 8E]|uniref:type II secretion system minor pseudopilin GspI n=1 Tax=Endozoicomonas sp. 8E TaxID=3035692 RepID=UPI002938F59A|nr:type II secretion system minor pseudopilin GspI [Endozoicomonas sp. 8E]WOG28333.1 type II secretion system minor pseudopilin GspI [Endozoicomonas sp. 8E]